MAASMQKGSHWRDMPPPPGPQPGHSRSNSARSFADSAESMAQTHARTNSTSIYSPRGPGHATGSLTRTSPRLESPITGTFAPAFVKNELHKSTDNIGNLEGENDFSGKRYVWVKDPDKAFKKGWVVEEIDTMLRIQCEDGSVRITTRIIEIIYSTDWFDSSWKWIRTTSTRSILQSLTRWMIWQSSHISTKRLLCIICT